MRIAFDPQIFSLQQYGGISRYFFETAAHLVRMQGVEAHILAGAHQNGYLAAAAPGLVAGVRLPPLPEPCRPLLMRANRLLARHWLARHGADIVHETYYSSTATAPGTATVITVLDMIHEKFPHFASGTEKVVSIKRQAIQRADHVICISQNTRRDLLQLIDIEPSKTSVVGLGFSLQTYSAPGATPPFPEPYILFVGKRGSYKNFDTLLKAYAASTRINRSHALVCFGDAPFSADELALARNLGLPQERLQHRGGGDAILAAYYSHAALFVYPSRYEGFGIPPLEAMSLDCPVVCSNAASLPEVVGEAAQTFDPDDADALRAAMAAVLDSPDTAERLRQLGRERVRLFSWDNCARQTRSVYASLLQETGRSPAFS